MKHKQRRKRRKERDKNKNQKKAKKKDKKEEKRTRTRERETEREIEKGGGQKRLRTNKGRHSKINKNCPFCETTSTVTTSGSPPQSTTKPELLTCHLWLKEERVCQAAKGPAHNYDDNDNSKRELRAPGDDRGLRRLQ